MNTNTPYSKAVAFLQELRGDNKANNQLLDLFYSIATNEKKVNKGSVIPNGEKFDRNRIRILDNLRIRRTLAVSPDSFLIEEGEKVLKDNPEVDDKNQFFSLLKLRLEEMKKNGLDKKGYKI